VLLALDGNVIGGEAGDGDRDAVGVLARALDVVGRVGLGLLPDEVVEPREQAVEADRGAVEGGKIEGLHLTFSFLSNVLADDPGQLPNWRAVPAGASGPRKTPADEKHVVRPESGSRGARCAHELKMNAAIKRRSDGPSYTGTVLTVCCRAH